MVREFTPRAGIAIGENNLAIQAGGMTPALKAFEDADDSEKRVPTRRIKKKVHDPNWR